MKRLLNIFVLMLVLLSGRSQSYLQHILPRTDSTFERKLTGKIYFDSKMVKGSPFLYADWTRAEIKLDTGEKIDDKLLNYNGLIDEFVWLNTQNFAQVVLDRAKIKEVQFSNGHHFRLMNIDNRTDSMKIKFVDVLVEGSYSLFVYHRVVQAWPEYKMVDNVRRKYDVLEYHPVYCVRFPSGRIIQMNQLNTRNVYRIFSNMKPQVKAIIRSRHLKMNKPADLETLIRTLTIPD